MARRRRAVRFAQVKDFALFMVGLGLTINEAVRGSGDRPALYVLFAAMMGLAFTLPVDRRRRDRGEDETDDGQ